MRVFSQKLIKTKLEHSLLHTRRRSTKIDSIKKGKSAFARLCAVSLINCISTGSGVKDKQEVFQKQIIEV